jgi:hypothetical protein
MLLTPGTSAGGRRVFNKIFELKIHAAIINKETNSASVLTKYFHPALCYAKYPPESKPDDCIKSIKRKIWYWYFMLGFKSLLCHPWCEGLVQKSGK